MISSSAKTAIALVLVATTTFGFVYWRVRVHPGARQETHGMIVVDISGSVTNDFASVVGLAEQFLNQPKLTHGSSLSVITTGDGQTRNEPRLLARYDVPFSRRAVEGRGAIRKKKREILIDLQSKLADLKQTGRSPIFLAIKRGIEHLRSSGCTADSTCYLFVRTDGEELSERAIRDSIDSGIKRKRLPEVASNEGVRVTFCGLAEVNTSRHSESSKASKIYGAQHGDRLRDTWLSLFSSPALVSFEPYCPRSEVSSIAEK
jgi:hypothetical protein